MTLISKKKHRNIVLLSVHPVLNLNIQPSFLSTCGMRTKNAVTEWTNNPTLPSLVLYRLVKSLDFLG